MEIFSMYYSGSMRPHTFISAVPDVTTTSLRFVTRTLSIPPSCAFHEKFFDGSYGFITCTSLEKLNNQRIKYPVGIPKKIESNESAIFLGSSSNSFE